MTSLASPPTTQPLTTTTFGPQYSRNLLSGQHLRVFTNYELPFVALLAACQPQHKDTRWPAPMPPECLEGLTVDFLAEMAASLNFTYTLFFPKDKKWGGIDSETGEWNGCIRHLLDEEGDLIVASMSINRIRSSAVTFSHPYHFTGRGFMLKKAEEREDFFRFAAPFKADLWYAFLGTLVVVSLLLNLGNKLSPYDFHGHFVYSTTVDGAEEAAMHKYRLKTYQRYRKHALGALDVGNAFWSAFAGIFHESGGFNDAWSGRIVLVSWWALILIVTSTYTANLTAWLTQARLEGDVETVGDLLNSPALSYGVIGSTGTESALVRKANRSAAYATLLRNLRLNSWEVNTEAEGVQRVQGGDFAFFLPKSTILSYTNKRPCNTRLARETFGSSIYGVAMSKPALHLKTLNDFVHRSLESGLISRLERKWFVEKGECQGSGEGGTKREGQLGTGDMAGVGLVLLGAMAAGLPLLLCEKLRHRSQRKDKDRAKATFARRQRHVRAQAESLIDKY